jgi:hypothetical protein
MTFGPENWLSNGSTGGLRYTVGAMVCELNERYSGVSSYMPSLSTARTKNVCQRSKFCRRTNSLSFSLAGGPWRSVSARVTISVSLADVAVQRGSSAAGTRTTTRSGAVESGGEMLSSLAG